MIKNVSNEITHAQVQCTNDKCEFYWICNDVMVEKALQDEGWCNKRGKRLTK